jgi:hypothetical protein
MSRTRWPARLTLLAFAALGMAGCPQLMSDDFQTVPAAGASGGGTGGADGSLGGTGPDGGATGGADGGDADPCAACTADETCCDSVCINLQNDPGHCGSCDTGCPGTACVAGQCSAVCALGHLDCDQNAVNGCEVDAATDPDNCGSCQAQCSFDQTCDLGKCVCPAGAANCDGQLQNGCEVDLATDSANCGACGVSCGANQACVDAKCACAAGFGDCNGDGTDGCEANLSTSDTNCGACNLDCGTNGACASGQCGCVTGFLDCDGTPGCETAKNDPQNCATCGTVCSGGTNVCNGTACVTGCTSAELKCGGSCVDPNTDPLHCGDCNQPVGAHQVCTGGAPTCVAGWGDCNGSAGDGCETDLTSDEANCGACSTQCKPGAVCTATGCQCAPSTPKDCGSACHECCGSADCADSDACTTDSCGSSGTCSHTSCSSDNKCCALGCFECCQDGDCPNGQVCSGNQCVVPSCVSPQILCNAVCVNPDSDAKNCGGCGIDCGAGRNCSSGKCTPNWVTMGTSGAPSARSHAAYAPLPGLGKVFVWGGQSTAGAALADGAIYDLASNAWTPVPTDANTPSARVLAGAVWTGSVVFVWGGASQVTGGSDLATGALYDPSGSWKPVAALGAPSARRAPYLVWTGSRVLLWGGTDSSGTPVADAYLYDPPNDVWTAANALGAPSARSDSTTGFNNASFFVFGGHNGNANYNNTYGYQPPPTDLWSPLATGPSARFGAFGRWDGSYFIAWGGRKQTGGPASTYNDGRRYDPSIDNWSNITTSNQPSPRYAPNRQTGWSARVAGGTLLMLGGLDTNDAPLTDGVLYFSTPNSFTAVASWPSGQAHLWGVGAWADSEFVLWGGQNPTTATATGERYRP